jgi:hypothetical protein
MRDLQTEAFAYTSYPRGHCGGTEKVKVSNTGLLTTFSVNGEYTSNTLSEPRGCFLSASEGVRETIHPRGCFSHLFFRADVLALDAMAGQHP